MICAECLKGGQWNKHAASLDEDNPQRLHYFLLAEECHDLCEWGPKSGSCMCQHGVGAGWIANDTVRPSA